MTLDGNRSFASANLERMAKILDASVQYRVLRRLTPPIWLQVPAGTSTRKGLLIDLETTGLDHNSDEVIEVAIVPFRYSDDGVLFEIGPAFHSFNEPSRPIPTAVTKLTGISAEMVAGHQLDLDALRSFADGTALVVAHNAGFDRRFAEKLSDVFENTAWACSMTDIDWPAEGYEGTKLVYLASESGFFYERHRAEYDCYAAIELLTLRLPVTKSLAMNAMLENARKVSWRIWAEESPFDLKDVLKRRGYRWNGDVNGKPRSWYIDVDDDARDAELAFLRSDIYLRDVDLFIQKITAYNRFSDRM